MVILWQFCFLYFSVIFTVQFVITSLPGMEGYRICPSVSVQIEILIQMLTQYACCGIYHISLSVTSLSVDFPCLFYLKQNFWYYSVTVFATGVTGQVIRVYFPGF